MAAIRERKSSVNPLKWITKFPHKLNTTCSEFLVLTHDLKVLHISGFDDCEVDIIDVTENYIVEK